MCLSRAIQIFPAEDISVYKVLKVSRIFDEQEAQETERYFSPYFLGTEWYLGEKKSIQDKEPDIKEYKLGFGNICEVNGGVFHSMEYFDEAERLATWHMEDDFMGDCLANYAVCRFTIPKDSRYIYSGVFGTYTSYASSDIVFEEVLKYVSPLED